MIKLTRMGQVITIPERVLQRQLAEGWTLAEANPENEQVQLALGSEVDSGLIQAKAPKKKSAKTAETAPEAAIEDLGNDITQGE